MRNPVEKINYNIDNGSSVEVDDVIKFNSTILKHTTLIPHKI